MPDPIKTTDSSASLPIDGASPEEISGQVCLPRAVPNASVSRATPAADGPVPSPAVKALVARFSPPTGSHAPIKPSLIKAIGDCTLEVANAALAAATVAGASGGLVTTLVAGARGLMSGVSAGRCIERDEAQQVAAGEIANQSADCERDGAIPLSKADGSVICARP